MRLEIQPSLRSSTGAPSHLAAALLLATGLVAATPCLALLAVDFEQAYYVHDGWLVWDHCLVEDQGVHHLFYLALPESDPYPTASDHIWHATSTDLKRWSEPEIAISVSVLEHETEALWAPDVVWDEASGRWWMAYTGVDVLYNQSICMAWSPDLQSWSKSTVNPVMVPSPPLFRYDPSGGGSECRDPYLYRDGGLWHLLATAQASGGTAGQGAILHTTGSDLEHWLEPDIFLLNEGETPTRALESCQYHHIAGAYHLFFHEYDSNGITHLGSLVAGDWSFEGQTLIDYGVAPEVDSFDGGASWLLSRSAPYQEPIDPAIIVAVRIDTLRFDGGTEPPDVLRADPWAGYASSGGIMRLGNPCFGDNPAARGDEPVGLVGNSYLGTAEFFRGPLSGGGSPGLDLGDIATGYLQTRDFVVEGDSIRFLIGGTHAPETCFMALVDAAADTVLRLATGEDNPTMVPRSWCVRDLQGRTVYLRIEDSDSAAHLNVDEIFEIVGTAAAVPADAMPAAGLVDRGAVPNPFNPRTALSFATAGPTTVQATVYDLRGRRIWSSGRRSVDGGTAAISWSGSDDSGDPVPAGVYLYRLEAASGETVAGKMILLP